MSNFGHHNEFDESGLKINDIKNKIENREMFYNHFLDQTMPINGKMITN